MASASRTTHQASIEIARSLVRPEEHLYGSIFGDIARLLWPHKTAANLAALVGCTERAAEFYLASDREWSGDAIAAVVAEIMRRHGARNLKITKREGRP